MTYQDELNYRTQKIFGALRDEYPFADTYGNSSKMQTAFGLEFKFDTVTSWGIKPEGEAVPWFNSARVALGEYEDAIRMYIRGRFRKSLQIYWREIPRLENENGKWSVFSRLLVGPVGLTNPPKKESSMSVQDYYIPEYLQIGWRSQKKGPNPDNKSGFRATGHRILLVPEEVETKTESGIILAAKTVHAEEQRAVIATVLEIGPDAWRDKSTDYCELGDRVLIGQYVGKFHTSPIDGKTYRFVSDLDIISPLPPKEEA